MAKSYLKKGFWCGIIALALCASCGDADLFEGTWGNKIEGWTPSFEVSVAHGEYTMWKLLNQGTDTTNYIKQRETDSLLYIEYTEENIAEVDVQDVFDMPAEDISFIVTIPSADFQAPSGVGGSLDLNEEQPLTQIPAGCELHKMIASAELVCNLPATGFEYSVQIIFANIYKEGEVNPYTTTLNVPASAAASVDKTISLDKVRVVLWDENAQTTQGIKMHVIFTAPSITTMTGDIQLAIALRQMKFIEVEGKIASPDYVVDGGQFNLDVDFLNEIGGNFEFQEPILNLMVHREGIDIPFRLEDLNFTAHNEEKNQSVTLALQAGSELFFTKENNYTQSYNKDNSNIREFLSLPPNGDLIYSSGRVAINPEGAADNFLRSDGKMSFDANIQIPLTLKASGLTYADTISDIDLSQNTTDKIIKAKICIAVENGIPFNVRLPELLLLTENNMLLMEPVKAAKNSQGEALDVVKASTSSTVEFYLDKDQVDRLHEMKHLAIKIYVSTDEGGGYHGIYGNARLSLKVKIAVQGEVNDFDFD